MTTKPIKNVSASVRARLLELSRKNGEQFNFVLTRYALERLLYRLGSTNRGKFVLKGAMLFALWTTRARHRPTVDMDLLAYGPPRLASTFLGSGFVRSGVRVPHAAQQSIRYLGSNGSGLRQFRGPARGSE
jgi:hypothetical protein